MSSPFAVPDGTPHFRRNVHSGIVVVVVVPMMVVLELVVVGTLVVLEVLVEVLVVVPKMVELVEVVVVPMMVVLELVVVETLVVLEVLVEVLVVELVVVEVVVVAGVQSGSPGCIVQVQVPALHWSRIADLQALRAAPDKPAHPVAISSEHAFEPQSDGAALAPETKAPAPSATAATNVTSAFLVM